MAHLVDASLLIVEDDAFTCSTLVEFCKRQFKEVWFAHSAIEAWNIYQVQKPDIILSDIELSNENGLEFIKRVRQEDAKTLIYILSGYPTQEYLLEAVKLHLEDFIKKPISTFKLNQFIENCIPRLATSKIPLSTKDDIFYEDKRKVLYVKGIEVYLTHMEIVLLELLIHYRSQIVSYDIIEEMMYSGREFGKDSLRTLLNRLRKKIGSRLIFSHPDIGYRLEIE